MVQDIYSKKKKDFHATLGLFPALSSFLANLTTFIQFAKIFMESKTAQNTWKNIGPTLNGHSDKPGRKVTSDFQKKKLAKIN